MVEKLEPMLMAQKLMIELFLAWLEVKDEGDGKKKNVGI